MCDPETFLTTLYVMVDDFCQTQLPARPTPTEGRPPALNRSEVVTLALLSRWHRFASERDFHRWAQRHLRPAFPTLPHQSQFNRLVRQHLTAITAFFNALADRLAAPTDLYEALDSTAAPIRNTKRRGRGWLGAQAERGWSNRLGWYFGFKVLLAVRPTGVITGFGFAPANTNDYPLAETFFTVRHRPDPALPSVGRPAPCPYLTDKGFCGPQIRKHWRETYGVTVVAPPRKNAKQPWPKPLRQWLAGLRQIVETVNGKLIAQFGLAEDRPKVLPGFQARLAARMALHNFCIWLNQQLDRPNLAFVDLVDW
jgi:hypothetical protein